MNQLHTRRLSYVVLAAASMMFLARGPARAVLYGHKSADLAPSFAASQAWIRGQNPYDHATLSAILGAEERELDASGSAQVSTALYPPPTYLAFLPLAFFSWPTARVVFLAANLILFGLHVIALLHLTGFSASDTRGTFLIAGVLSLAPYHTGIALGQPAIPCVCLLVIAIDQLQRHRDVRSGALLALAALFKPQLAIPFVGYVLVERRWRAASAAIAIGVVAWIIATGWLAIQQVQWVHSWIANNGLEMVGGGIDTEGPVAYHMIDGRLVLSALGVSSPELPMLALGALLGIVAIVQIRKARDVEELLVLALIAVWTLLIVYHRFYDAALLCLPFAWAVASIRSTRPRGTAIVVLGTTAVFFLPGQVMLARWAEDGWIAPSITRHWIWDTFALRHDAWALFVLFAALAVAVHQRRHPALRSNTLPDSPEG